MKYLGSIYSNISKKRKRIALGLLTSFLSIILLLMVLEGILRIGGDDSFPLLKTCAGPHSLREFDSQLSTVGTPGGSYLIKYTPGDSWDLYTHNGAGFRDVYDGGSSSVLVFGDSFTYGTLVSDESTFTHLLDVWSDDVQFKNYGFPTYGTAQELLLYRQVAESINHDLVILGYFSNDPADNNRADQSRFRLEEGELVLGPELEGRGVITAGPADRIQRFLADNTEIYGFFSPKLKQVLGGGDGNAEPATGDDLATGDNQYPLTRALIKQLAREVEINGAELLILAITPQAAVTGDTSDPRGPAWPSHLAMLNQVASEEPVIDLLDLTPILTEQLEAGNTVFGVEDLHINDYGHFVVAEAIQARLLSRDYVGTPNTAEVSFNPDKADVVQCP